MVKKSLFTTLSVMCMLIIILASCSRKAEYTRVIPADASLVVSFDVKSMVEKSGIADKSNEVLLKKLFDSMKSGLSANAVKQAEKMMKNPQESGLSLTDKMYLFYTPKNIAFVIKVSDEAKLKETFKVLETEKACSATEKGDGYSWVTVEGQTICAFNENTLLVMGSVNSSGIESLKTDAGMLMAQKEENSIRKNEGFKKMDNKKEDIAIFASLAGIPEMYLAQASVGLPAGANLKDMMLLGSINFEKGKIVAKAEMFTENKELQKMYEQRAEMMGKPSGEFLGYFPASSLMFMNFSLKGEKIYEMLASNPEFSEVMKNKEGGLDMEKVFSSFDGDISVGLTSFSGLGMPALTAYAKVKDDYLLKILVDQKQMLEMGLGVKLSEKGKNAYQLNYRGVDIYLGLLGNHLYATNNAAILGRLNEKANEPLTDAAWVSQAKKSPVFFALNVAEIMKNPLMSALTSSGGSNMSMAASIFSQCAYIQAYEVSKETGEIDIVLRNQDENVLKQIVNGIGAATGN